MPACGCENAALATDGAGQHKQAAGGGGRPTAPAPSAACWSPGVASYWGGRLAQTLESDPSIEAIVGVDSEEPTRELTRTEFVRIGNQHALIRRIVGRRGSTR